MKKLLIFAVILVVAIVLIVYIVRQPNSNGQPAPVLQVSSIPANFTQTLSDGTITIAFPPSDFALATSQAQVTVRSYIPPCDQGFGYCLYYNGTAYTGTNFESAGIRVQMRADLTTQSDCLTTEPTGFTGQTPIVATSSDYAVSIFPQVGDAGAGHYAVGSLYRLSYGGACYEFETRIGQTQFANYPSGAIQLFTAADQTSVQSEMQQILGTLTLPSGEQVVFPQA